MPITEGILVKPVGMGDISTVVGIGGPPYDLGYMITNGTINKWAKYKPVAYAEWGEMTEAQRALTKYGLTAPGEQTSLVGVITSADWVYTRPSGGSSSPFRMLDFDGYYPEAIPPVESVRDPLVVYRALQSSLNLDRYISTTISRYAIGWEDLPSVNGMYLCAAFSNNASFTISGSTQKVIYKTSSQTFSNSPTLQLTSAELNTLQSGGYTYYLLCAAKVAKTTFGANEDAAQRFRVLPSADKSDLTGALQFSNGLAARVEFKTACFTSNPTSASAFTDVTDYTEARVDPQYLLIRNYYLHLGLDITAFEDMDCTLTATALSIGVPGGTAGITQTFAGTGPGYIPIMTSGGLRNSSFTAVNTLTIPAGETQRVYFLFSNAILRMDSSGQEQASVTTGQQISPIIRLAQNGTIFANVSINLQN